jgi:6-phosphogluconolactonase (cycloisomerase 2 family)
MTKGYIGSYTKKNGQGIYQFDLDEQNDSKTCDTTIVSFFCNSI